MRLVASWLSYVHRRTVLRLRILEIRLAFLFKAIEPFHQRIYRFLERCSIVKVGIHSIGCATKFARAHFQALLDRGQALLCPGMSNLGIHALNFADRRVVGNIGGFRSGELLEVLVVEYCLQMLEIIRPKSAFGRLDFWFAHSLFVSFLEDIFAVAMNREARKRIWIAGNVATFAIGDAIQALRVDNVSFQIQIGFRTLQPQQRRRVLAGGDSSERQQDSEEGQQGEYLVKAEPRNHFVPPSLVTLLPAMIYRMDASRDAFVPRCSVTSSNLSRPSPSSIFPVIKFNYRISVGTNLRRVTCGTFSCCYLPER